MARYTQSRITGHVERDAFVIRVAGEVESDDDEAFEEAWDEADAQGLAVTVVDLSQVRFGNSGLLNELLRGRSRHLLAGRSFVVAGPLSPPVERLFSVTGVYEHFTFAQSLDSALD
ncbi:STAS domain-containing protein [Streptomyces apricus]|uniref:STAS domain-containing protein n=1 Tax=Streptomyces apricus TaxID=1828112 RepID=A0A5B0B1G9_9ACTN|nr:STAS domain-containing protein [Streptomyces apricus]KAA0934659.1 STAS domain-containing protein [Streptomyces apricus]